MAGTTRTRLRREVQVCGSSVLPLRKLEQCCRDVRLLRQVQGWSRLGHVRSRNVRCMEMGVPAAARELGVTEEAVRLRLRNGEMQGRRVRVGRRDRWFVDASEVARWRDRRVVLGAPVPSRGPVQERLPNVSEEESPSPEDRGRTGADGVVGELERLRLEVRVLRAALREFLGEPGRSGA